MDINNSSSLWQMKESALGSWRIYAKYYQDAIPEYQRLERERSRMGIEKIRINKDVLEGMMDVPFLKLPTEDQARAYIANLNRGDLAELNREIKKLAESYEFRTIREKIKESKCKLTLAKSYKNPFGVDPNYGSR